MGKMLEGEEGGRGGKKGGGEGEEAACQSLVCTGDAQVAAAGTAASGGELSWQSHLSHASG